MTTKLTVEEMLETMRQNLRPRGDGDSVLIRITSPYQMFEFPHSFIQECVDDFEALVMTSVTGFAEPSNLEKLAIQLLLSSAYLDTL